MLWCDKCLIEEEDGRVNDFWQSVRLPSWARNKDTRQIVTQLEDRRTIFDNDNKRVWAPGITALCL